MPGFTIHAGKIAVVPGDNIDTDRIIPARFLTRVGRSGYGELLFEDVRSPQFALDQPEAKDASILVVGTNFGCGSSREHAVWAIQQAGYRAVIALKTESGAGFSDIFRGNAANCGLLLIELDAPDHAALSETGSGAEVTVNLPEQTISPGARQIHFEIDPGLKSALVEGLDLIGTTLRHEDVIEAYESKDRHFVPPAQAVAV